MNQLEPKEISFYAQKIIKSVPKEAFKPATYKLVPMFAHAILFWLNVFLISNNLSNSLLVGVCSILMGISIVCLFLFAHELTHRTIVKKQPFLYILEIFFWAFSGFPPTLWRKLHNATHHKHMNTYDDPDRKTFKSEANFLNKIYNLFIYPNKKLRYSFTVGFAMIFYSTKHILAVYYNKENKPSIVTFRPNYSKKEIRKITLELLFVFVFWGSVAFIINSWIALIVMFVSWTVYSAGAITFIITQHQRDPVFIDVADPLLTSTSVIIPKWLDWFIDWHSFHVEHHVLPGINFDYYPQVSEQLAKEFPDRYQRMPIVKAIQEAYDEDVFVDDPLI